MFPLVPPSRDEPARPAIDRRPRPRRPWPAVASVLTWRFRCRPLEAGRRRGYCGLQSTCLFLIVSILTTMPASGVTMFGLVARFTLKPEMGDQFDLLTRQTVSRVDSEPGTLTYACHLVHSDPDARLFYELYRDRAAFEEHERTDHVRRFL